MIFGNWFSRGVANGSTTKLIVAYDEPFMGYSISDESGVRRSMHSLDPAKIDIILTDFSTSSVLIGNDLVRGLCCAFQRETFDAFETWFTWLQEGIADPLLQELVDDSVLQVRFHSAAFLSKMAPEKRSDPAAILLNKFSFESLNQRAETAVSLKHLDITSHLDKNGCANPRAVLLEKLWITFYDYSWKSQLRFGVLEAIAIALSKYYGQLGNYTRALHFVDKSLSEPSLSIHLKSAKHVLQLYCIGETVPPWLVRFAGPDNGYLKDFVCEAPFQRFDIVETGEINICCGHWLPKSVGNIDESSLNRILNSQSAQSIRKSTTDGSYKYCNHLECSVLSQNKVTRRDSLKNPQVIRSIERNDFSVSHVDSMLFAYDQSCNLACPSCRRERIIEKPSLNEAKAYNVEHKLMPLLAKLKHLEINVAGEVFVSKPSRKILSMISHDTCPDLKIDLISNGILFTESEWAKFPGIHGKVNGVRISIDAATKPTFEKLRRLAIYEILLDNLLFIQHLRQEQKIGGLTFSFTYQLDNFREMEDFVYFARAYGVDKVNFEPLQNVGAFSGAEYLALAVHKSGHPLFSEFLEMIRRPVFASSGIQHDFASYDYKKFRNTDLFLSQSFSPSQENSQLDGLSSFPVVGGTQLTATSDYQHHRILMQDNFDYHGNFRFNVRLKPLSARMVGIELHTLDKEFYGRILFDFIDISVVIEHSVLEKIDNVLISTNTNGWFELIFTIFVQGRTGLALNLYLVNDQAEVSFSPTVDHSFIAGRINAQPI